MKTLYVIIFSHLIMLSLTFEAAAREVLPSPVYQSDRSASMEVGNPVKDVLSCNSQDILDADQHTLSMVLAEYHVWHGLPSHSQAFSGASWLPYQRAYDSRDSVVIANHIAKARAMGINGFVVNYYGPQAGVTNDVERAFMDEAIATLLVEAEKVQGFCIALLYDEGTVKVESSTDSYQTRVISDLNEAKKYFSSPAYLQLRGYPALFIFPYDDVDPFLDWSSIRGALSTQLTLIDQDPNPNDPVHDENFDGFFSWVQPTDGVWDPTGNEWGEGYLQGFYSTMTSEAYTGKIAVGGVWPGFDDSLAPWGKRRFISRQGEHVYSKTWDIAAQHRVPIVLIATWNDFEEGTDIEFGVRMIVDMENPSAEILLRSSPFQINWDPTKGEGVLQVYKNKGLIYNQKHSSGVTISLESEHAYEIKVWLPDGPTPLTPLVQTIKIRSQENISALDIDGSGQYSALTDGILNIRYLFGLRGEVLINGAVDSKNCTRCTASEIETYLDALQSIRSSNQWLPRHPLSVWFQGQGPN